MFIFLVLVTGFGLTTPVSDGRILFSFPVDVCSPEYGPHLGHSRDRVRALHGNAGGLSIVIAVCGCSCVAQVFKLKLVTHEEYRS